MYYPDGHSPPQELISIWLTLLESTFAMGKTKEDKPCIALHCVAGLGRLNNFYYCRFFIIL